MATAYRIDGGTLRKPTKTTQGFLRCDGHASRVGVFEYMNHDGTVRRELRLPEDVFHADSLASYEGASLTDGHPVVEVTADNVANYERGAVTGPARRDGDHVAVSIVAKSPAVIAKMERGDTGLSTGYKVELEETPGVHPIYGRYDAIQRKIIVNHLAVGVVPRAGDTARVRMDGIDRDVAIQFDRNIKAPDSQDMKQPPDDMSPEEQIRFLKAKNEELTLRADEADKKASESKLRADSLAQKLDVETSTLAAERARHAKALEVAEGDEVKKLIARADSAERELATLRTETPALVNARAELLVRGRTVLGDASRFDSTSPDRLIEEAIIKHYEPAFKCDGLSDHEVKARADARYQSRMASAESLQRMGEVLSGNSRRDSDPQNTREARAKAWNQQALNPNGYKPQI